MLPGRVEPDPVHGEHDAGGFLALLDGLAVGGIVEPDRLPPARLGALLAAALPV